MKRLSIIHSDLPDYERYQSSKTTLKLRSISWNLVDHPPRPTASVYHHLIQNNLIQAYL